MLGKYLASLLITHASHYKNQCLAQVLVTYRHHCELLMYYSLTSISILSASVSRASGDSSWSCFMMFQTKWLKGTVMVRPPNACTTLTTCGSLARTNPLYPREGGRS